jgi:hypothetical protein
LFRHPSSNFFLTSSQRFPILLTMIVILLAIYLGLCAYLATGDLRNKYKENKYLTPAEVAETVFSFWAIGIGLLLLVVGLVVFYIGMGLVYTYVYLRKFLSFKLNHNFWQTLKFTSILSLVCVILGAPFANNLKFFFILQTIGFVVAVVGSTIVLNLQDRSKNGKKV